MEDYFQSYTLSIVIAWVLSISLIISFVGVLISSIFEHIDGVSHFYRLWLFGCILLFSPVRYLLFQTLVTISYPFQSFRALITTLLLFPYIPIVFGILYAISFVIPLIGVFVLLGFRNTVSKFRLWLSALVSPFVFLIGSYLFYLLLPYAAYSTHWLNEKDVIRATNGPAEYFYRYAVEPFSLLHYPNYVKKIGFDNLSYKERLRSHVAIIYLGEKQYTFFVYKSFPEEYKQ